MEADQVGAEQAVDDLGAPRHLHEQLDRRERDVQEEADGQVGPQHAQHLRDQLQLVVLDPHGRALGGRPRGRLGEAPVDLDVAVPPLPVVDRFDDHVVVERPQRGVGEALVVQRRRRRRSAAPGTSVHAVLLDRRRCRRRRTASSGTPGQPIHAPRRLRSSGSSAVTRPPGLRFHSVVPSGSRSMSIGSRLATTTKSAEPAGGADPRRSGPRAALGGHYASASLAGPMPSIDRKTRHSSASVAYAATTRRAWRSVLSAMGSTSPSSAGSDFAGMSQL